jgi:hypothetical protein
VTEQRQPEQDDVTLAEIEVESDIMDADIEGLAPAHERAPHEALTRAHEPPELSEEDLAEAEAEADVMDADVEGA